MTTHPDGLLSDALDYLEQLVTDAADPATAQRRLAALRTKHDGIRMRVVWQREEYDDSRHYDLLLMRPDCGTVSLSYCPDRALPWSLRGGQRISERLLLRVNGTPMEVDQAIACLDFLWDEARLTDRLITACLVRQALEEDPVELSDGELQAAMDAFRRAHDLLTPAATEEWMARRCLSHTDLEELVEGEAAVARLRRRITDGHLQAFFDRERSDFDRTRITRLLFTDGACADHVVRAVATGQDFYAVAARAAAAGLLAEPAALVEVRHRSELPDELGRAVFDARPGSVVGPLRSGAGHAVVLVLAVEPAVFDDATAELVRQRLFTDWLERRRGSAHVEWFWGNAARTATRDQPGR